GRAPRRTFTGPPRCSVAAGSAIAMYAARGVAQRVLAVAQLHLVVQIVLTQPAGRQVIEELGRTLVGQRTVEVLAGPAVLRVLVQARPTAQRILAIAQLHLGLQLALAVFTASEVIEEQLLLLRIEGAIEIVTGVTMRCHLDPLLSLPRFARCIASSRVRN